MRRVRAKVSPLSPERTRFRFLRHQFAFPRHAVIPGAPASSRRQDIIYYLNLQSARCRYHGAPLLFDRRGKPATSMIYAFPDERDGAFSQSDRSRFITSAYHTYDAAESLSHANFRFRHIAEACPCSRQPPPLPNLIICDGAPIFPIHFKNGAISKREYYRPAPTTCLYLILTASGRDLLPRAHRASFLNFMPPRLLCRSQCREARRLHHGHGSADIEAEAEFTGRLFLFETMLRRAMYARRSRRCLVLYAR